VVARDKFSSISGAACDVESSVFETAIVTSSISSRTLVYMAVEGTKKQVLGRDVRPFGMLGA